MKKGHFQRRGGMAVLAVLGFLVIGTWLTMVFLQQVEMEIRRNPSSQTVEDLRSSAYQALELTIAVLDEIRGLDGGLYSPAQGWGNPLEYAQARQVGESLERGDERLLATAPPILKSQLPEESAEIAYAPGVRLTVSVVDRNGKIPFEGTTENSWVEIGKVVGFSQSEALLLRDSLLDWMDADENARPFGAEADQYRSRRMAYTPPNRPVQSMDELRYILNVRDLLFDGAGRPLEQWKPFRDLVGIRPSGEVNWNTASFVYFQLMEEETGISAERIWEFLVGKDGVKGTFDDGILRPGINNEDLPRDRNGNYPPLERQVGQLDVSIRASRGETVFLLQALLDPVEKDAGGVYPLKIVELRENSEKY